MHQDNPLTVYLRDFIGNVNEHYKWSFNEVAAAKYLDQPLPAEATWFDKTLALKARLKERLAQSDSRQEHLQIASYFISDWGGVGTNKNLERIVDWTRAQAAEGRQAFEQVELKGVSSWSKYLSLLCDWAPIYDSRVAFAINAINYMHGQLDCFYPMPEGRSPRLSLIDLETLFLLARLDLISDDDVRHRQLSARVQKKFHIPEKQAYSRYVALLEEVAIQLGLGADGHHQVEMLLFSMAPERIFSDLLGHLRKTQAVTPA